MNILKGLFNPLEMYTSLARMDEKKAKFCAIAIIISTFVIGTILSLLPMAVVTIPKSQLLLASLITNSQLTGFCILFPLSASIIARYFVKRDAASDKSSASDFTTFYKSFLIITTSTVYVMLTSLVIMFELAMLLSFTTSTAPHWVLLVVTYAVMFFILIETILMLIWYVYKPFSVIYKTNKSAILKRLSMIIAGNLIALVPCSVMSSLVSNHFGLEALSSSTITAQHPQENKVISKIILNPDDTDPLIVDTSNVAK